MTQRAVANVLTIAGSDSGGGAGIQADLKTFQAIGCYGMSAITVLTAQNTQTVRSIFPSSPEFLKDQLAAVFEDIYVDAVKIGMVYSSALVEVIANALKTYNARRIVLDPVMVAKGGSPLLQTDAVDALKSLLLPLADLITPNLPEAEILVGEQIQTRDQMEHAISSLLRHGPRVVLKGGHLGDAAVSPDLYATRSGDWAWISYPRIVTVNTHGTGCTYSSAIAAFAALGVEWRDSVKKARAYLQQAILSGADLRIGKGYGPVDHRLLWNQPMIFP